MATDRPVIAQECPQDVACGPLRLRLERFRQLAADVQRHGRNDRAEQEWHAPAPCMHRVGREGARENHASKAAKEDRQLLAVALPRGDGRALVDGHGLEQIRCRRSHFSATGETLNQAGDEKDDRRGQPDLGVRRRHGDDRGAERHEQQRQRQRGAPALSIGIRPDDRGSERPGYEAHAEGGEGAQQPRDLRFAGKERVRDHHGEEREDEEIVELEEIADDDRDDGFHRERRGLGKGFLLHG